MIICSECRRVLEEAPIGHWRDAVPGTAFPWTCWRPPGMVPGLHKHTPITYNIDKALAELSDVMLELKNIEVT